jgi:hypothetical protein
MIFAQRSIEEYTATVTEITNKYGLFREETFVFVYEICLNAKAVVVMALAASQFDIFQLCIRSYVHAHKQPSFVLDTPFASSHIRLWKRDVVERSSELHKERTPYVKTKLI